MWCDAGHVGFHFASETDGRFDFAGRVPGASVVARVRASLALRGGVRVGDGEGVRAAQHVTAGLSTEPGVWGGVGVRVCGEVCGRRSTSLQGCL